MANRIIFPIGYYPDPDRSKSVALGDLYIGEKDKDPTVVANQKTVSAVQESGTTVGIPQPISLSAGGVPTYDGSETILEVDGSYSMTVLDSNGIQVYTIPDATPSTVSEVMDVISVDSIADLKARTDEPGDGDLVEVLGYYTPGDQGGGSFYWDASSTDTDNGGTIIKVTSIATGRWLRLYEGDIYARWFGAKGDGVTDDTTYIEAIETFAPTRVNLDGGTYDTTLTIDDVSTIYFNGSLLFSVDQRQKPQKVVDDFEITRPRTKTPLLDWEDQEILWLGHSLATFGTSTEDTYPQLVASAVGSEVTNNAVAGSHAYYDVDGDPNIQTTISALSMTEDDRAAGEALHGSGSQYGTVGATQSTADYRIENEFADVSKSISVVMLDHNHNDRQKLSGTLNPTRLEISDITKGVTTDIDLVDASTITVGDSVTLEVNGIDNLNYASGRVQAKASNTITMNIDSSGYSGTFSDGELIEYDKNTIYGAFNFLISYIKNISIIYGDGSVNIILSGAPSEYTSGTADSYIWPAGEAIKDVAEKWELSFFDIGFLYDVKLQDQSVFFPDTIHPTTLDSREAMTNYWVEWMVGGATKNMSLDVLPGARSGYLNDREALYSDYDEKFDTRNRIITEGDEVIDFPFDNLTGWTTSGDTAPVIAVIPSTAENSMYCESTAALDSSYVLKDFSAVIPSQGDNPITEFELYLPVVSGLTSTATTKTVSLMRINNASGAVYFLTLVVTQTQVTFSVGYRETDGGSLENVPVTQTPLTAATLHNVVFTVVKGDANNLGYISLVLDGIELGSKAVDTQALSSPLTTTSLGVITSDTGENLDVYIDNFKITAQTDNDYSGRYTGAFSLNRL